MIVPGRQRHLEEFNKTESLSKFTSMAGQVPFDMDSVLAAEQEEVRMETKRNTNSGNPRK